MSTETNLDGLVETRIRSRVILKHDIEANWIKAVNFVPWKGELIIYDVEDSSSELPQGRTFRYETVRFKFGDGVTNVNDLAFVETDGGYNTVELGDYAHAEGFETRANTDYSHAEGYRKHDDELNNQAGMRGFSVIDSIYSGGTYKLKLDSVEGIQQDYIFCYSALEEAGGKFKSWRPGKIQNKIIAVDEETCVVTIEQPLYFSRTSVIMEFVGGQVKHPTLGLLPGNPDPAFGGNFATEGGYVEYTNRLACKIYFWDHPDLGTSSVTFGAHSEGRTTFAIGDSAHSEGRQNISIGDYAHTEGRKNRVFVESGHAEGNTTTVAPNDNFDSNGHAQGVKTTARGNGAHAEGVSGNSAFDKLGYTVIRKASNNDILTAWKTTHNKTFLMSNGSGSHAEGQNTLANGEGAHAEGRMTLANDMSAHSEGFLTEANGVNSHAEGLGTIANGAAQHVQGRYNIKDINNSYAHIIGHGISDEDRRNIHTIDWSGKGWFAGGVITDGNLSGDQGIFSGNITGKGSISAGLSLRNDGQYSSIFGRSARIVTDNLIRGYLDAAAADKPAKMREIWTSIANPWERFSYVNGDGANSVGRNTVALALAHAEGADTAALGQGAHSEGYNTIAQGQYSHAEGTVTDATGRAAHAQGYNTIAQGQYSHAEGTSTISSGDASHAEGGHVIATRNYQHVQGRYNKVTGSGTKEDPYDAGNYAHIVGGGTSQNRKNIHTLDWDGNASFAGSGEFERSISITQGSLRLEGQMGFGVITSALDIHLQCGTDPNLYGTSPCSIYLNENTSVSCDGNKLTTPEIITSKISTSANTLEILASTKFENQATFKDNVSVNGAIACSERITCTGTVKGDVLEVNTIKIGTHELNATKLEKLLKFIETFEFED